MLRFGFQAVEAADALGCSYDTLRRDVKIVAGVRPEDLRCVEDDRGLTDTELVNRIQAHIGVVEREATADASSQEDESVWPPRECAGVPSSVDIE